MAHIWCNEVVAPRGVVGQIGGQLVVRPDVRNAPRRPRIQTIVDIAKVGEGEMLNVWVGKVQGTRITVGAAKIRFGAGAPGDASISRSLTRCWSVENAQGYQSPTPHPSIINRVGTNQQRSEDR